MELELHIIFGPYLLICFRVKHFSIWTLRQLTANIKTNLIAIQSLVETILIMSSKGGAPPPPNMEVFPDLHHKMSKKIAQLTKVIYHLNTKNEDHALEIEQINSNHQMEVQQILRDAANRIGKFKEALESKQAAVRMS